MTSKQKKELVKLIIASFLFVSLIILDKIFKFAYIIPGKYGFLLAFILYLIVYCYIGLDVLIDAIRNIFNGQFLDENFLMCLATIGAFALALYRGFNGMEIEGFDEAVAVMLFFEIGEFFEDYAVNKSRKSISSLMDLRPDFANVKKDDKIETISPEDVKIDDIIVVKPGEKIPLDGIIIKGNSSLDLKSLTGESIPVEVKENNEVLSGSINLTSILEIKVTKEFYDSTVSKILDLVENATNKKAKSENFITSFAHYYTPSVVFLAIFILLIPGFISHDWSTWLYRALSFLVVSCPCALVISIPLSFFSGIGAASRYGILIKGSNFLERFNDVKTFAFDKTGTLTKGNFVVTNIYPLENKDKIIKYACIAEKNSNHPIAKSILNLSNENKDVSYNLVDEAGLGIKAINDNNIILCGNASLVEKYNIEYLKNDSVGTIIHVAFNNEYLGYIVIEDEIKKESYTLIDYLNKNKIKSIMLTGDNHKIASSVANKLNISEFKDSLLPDNKVEEVEKIIKKEKNKEVMCFVGDGINDAPVLMMSDIGISMGSIGQDAAIEASDIVFMKDDLTGIILAKKIATKTMSIVKQNIIFALSIKLIILILSALGLTNMWLAIFGDVGVAILAILNAMRVNKKYSIE